jgi:hypothetical protein
MVPDFQAFVNLGGDKVLSHSWKGMFTYDFPLGLLLVLTFHYIVRNALIANLPPFLKTRFVFYTKIKNERYFSKRYLAITTSLLIGIATHLVWDRITHTDTYSYKEMIGLELNWYQSYKLRVLLQYGCSLAGLIIIAWQLYILQKFKPNAIPTLVFYWPVVAIVTMITYAIRFQYFHFGDDMINATIGAFMLGIVVASVLYNLKYYRSISVSNHI